MSKTDQEQFQTQFVANFSAPREPSLKGYVKIHYDREGYVLYKPGEHYRLWSLTRDASCIVKVDDLFVIATTCETFWHFQDVMVASGFFHVPYAGGATINIDHLLITYACDHLWQSYKALTG